MGEISYNCKKNSNCQNDNPKIKEFREKYNKDDTQYITKDLINDNVDKESMSKEEEEKYYNDIIKLIEDAFTDNYDTSILDKGEEEYIKTEKNEYNFYYC